MANFTRILLHLFGMFFLFSCSSVDKNEIKRLHNLNNQLVYSTKTIESQNEMIYRSLADRLSDFKFKERAQIWQPKALLIKDLAAQFKIYLSSLKKELRTESNERLENFMELWDEDNEEASTKIFIQHNKTADLNYRWENFINNVLKVDSSLTQAFKFYLTLPFNRDSTFKELQNSFNYSSAIGALSTLNTFENKSVILENMLVTYCHNQIPTVGGCDYGRGPSFLVYQNRNYLKPGEKLVITAGIAVYNFQSNPDISINGNKMELELNGSAVFSTKVKSLPGKYKIPVKIQFTGEDGKKVTKEKVIEYEIAGQ